MKILNLVYFLLLIIVHSSYAQNRGHYPLVSPKTILRSDSLHIENDSLKKQSNHLTIISDKRLEKILEIQKEECIRKGTIEGYRVQIYQGNKAGADKQRALFLDKYPDLKVYVKFLTPDFRVRIGDFRNKSEAIKLKYVIIKDFPNPFIVEDNINFPDLVVN